MGKEDKEEGQGFKIVDRRRFDSSGNEREDEEREAAQQPDGGERPKEQQAAFGDEAQIGGVSEVTLASFIMSLATQALMQLGEIQAPQGLDIPVDRTAAKQTIDILAMLREKTKGNLEKEEDELFEEILHNLRVGYLRKK